ncbi:DUF2848 family protein [Micromonospora sp. NPDC047707]|uniref:DUF2848 family protein n=1 Tax=Micromonospora sp. NPDC047707 TaxID=3154498 RepID=UPI00345170C2
MPVSARTRALAFTVVGSSERLSLSPRRLVIAGYTASDRAAVQAHIDELAHLGVAPPPRVPMFYDVPVGLATTETVIVVEGAETSGEVEPVLISTGGRLYLAVGSDHTDREVEKRDIAESKASAAKPVGDHVVPVERATAVWDDIEMVCRLDGEIYQRGRLAAMLPPGTLLDKLRAVGGQPLAGEALMFCGTLPLLAGTFVFGTTYELELRLPDGTSLSHSYDVKRRSS